MNGENAVAAQSLVCFWDFPDERVKWLGTASRETMPFNVGALFGQICALCGIDISQDDIAEKCGIPCGPSAGEERISGSRPEFYRI